jgi:hypothetical protein
MKKFQNVYVLMFAVVVIAVSLSIAQTRTVDKYGDKFFEGRPFFTDSALYNSYDLGGSPLGLFEKGSPRFDAQFDYRHDGLGDRAGQYWSAPMLTMGNPDKSFFRAFYDPRILTDKNGGNDVSLPLHRFGLVVAAQGESKALRAAFSVVGFYGEQEWDLFNDNRMVAGFDRIRFDLGSQVHPLLRLGLFVSGDMRYEKNIETDTERSCHTNLPEFGVNVDVGGEDFPVRGNLDFSYAWSRFVYTKNDYYRGDAIRNDSLSLFLTMQASLSPIDDDKLVLKPGLLLGFTNNSGERHIPEGGYDANTGNNWPINLGNAIKTREYGLTGFWFGAGTGVGVLNYVDAHVEYTLAAMSLDCGSYYTKPKVESRTLHHTAFGVSSNLNKYVDMPIVITPRLAYFISGMSGVGVSQARLSVDPLNAAFYDSKESLYNPQTLLNGFSHLSGFTIGVDGQVLEGQASASVWATFLSDSELDKGGLEFGARIGFILK